MVTEELTAPAATPSTSVESPSDAPEFVPSSPDAEPTATDETTQPETDENPEPEQPAEPTLESALDKQRAIDRGDDSVVLTGAELRLLREHERAETNRRNDLQRKADEARQASEALAKKFDDATEALAAELQSQLASLRKYGELDDFMQNASRDRLATLVNGLKASAEDIVMKPQLQRAREMILGAYTNPSTDTLKAVNDLQNLDQVISYVHQMGAAYGQTQGVPEGKVLVDKKDHERWTKADKAVEQSGNPTRVPPGGRTARSNGGPLTYDRWIAMTPQERAKVPPEQEQAMIASRMRGRR